MTLLHKNIIVNGKDEFLDNLSHLFDPNITTLHQIDLPIFIATESGPLFDLESLSIDEHNLSILRSVGCCIFLDEPLSLYREEGVFNRPDYNEFKTDVDIKDLKSTELESILKFQKQYDINNIIIYTQDFNVEIYKDNYPTLQLKCLDITMIRQIVRGLQYPTFDIPITKKFWSGNWRYQPSRHIMMSYLHRFSGNYSWHLKVPKELLLQVDWMGWNCDYGKIILDGAAVLENNVFCLDRPNTLVIGYNDLTLDSNRLPGGDRPSTMHPPFKSYFECFCAIVTESRYAQPTAFFTEKTIAAIGNLRPFILVAPPNSLKYLRSFGFKTFDTWWDESYDIEEDHQARMFKIFNLIDYINNLSIEKLNVMYEEMKEILEHNKSLIKEIPFKSLNLTK